METVRSLQTALAVPVLHTDGQISFNSYLLSTETDILRFERVARARRLNLNAEVRNRLSITRTSTDPDAPG